MTFQTLPSCCDYVLPQRFIKMKLFMSIFLLLECLPGLLADLRPCTPDETCLHVPARICDNSKCLSVDNDEMNSMTQAGTRLYTWNISRKIWNEYCSPKYTTQETKASTGETVVNKEFTFISGQQCNISTTRSSTLEPNYDACTGQLQFMINKVNGQVFEECIIYHDPGVAYVYRTCRTKPSNGVAACAAIFVREAESGNCNREKLLKFIRELGIEFPQIISDCV